MAVILCFSALVILLSDHISAPIAELPWLTWAEQLRGAELQLEMRLVRL